MSVVTWYDLFLYNYNFFKSFFFQFFNFTGYIFIFNSIYYSEQKVSVLQCFKIMCPKEGHVVVCWLQSNIVPKAKKNKTYVSYRMPKKFQVHVGR